MAGRITGAGVGAVLALGMVGALLVGASPRATDEPERIAALAPRAAAFVPNRGQWHESVRYAAWKDDVAAAFLRDSIRLTRAGGPSVSLRFRGASEATELVAQRRQAGLYNFVFGNDPSRWRTRIGGYGRLTYRGLYEGIDVAVTDRRGLAYDVHVAPGADLDRVSVDVEGARSIRIAKDGALLLRTQLGTLRQAPPVAWDVLPDGTKRPVGSSFALRGPLTYGFTVRGHDPALPLVVDPGLDWATFLGGAGDESIRGLEIVKDGTQDIVVAGQTASPDFPRTRGNLAPVGWMPYVARMNASGSELVYSTFFGGSFNHSVLGVGLDSQSRPGVVGDTNSLDFPTTPGAYDRTPGNGFQGDYDAFLIKFEADGSGPVFGTYLAGAPGSGLEQGWRVVFDANDAPIVGGITTSASFPTTAGAYDRVYSSGVTTQTQDVFISRFSPDGSQLTYSTYFGGDSVEDVYDMTLDPQGILTFTGKVSQFFDQPVLMPTTPDAYDRVHDGGGSTPEIDAYLVRFRLGGAGAADLVYSTFLGGAQYKEAGVGVAFDPADPGSVTVVGWTYSADFPTTPGAWLRTHFMPVDASMAFVSRFRFPAGNLEWSTFYGAPGSQAAEDVAIDSLGRPIFGGVTGAPNPTTTERAYDRVPGAGNYVGNGDGFVARLSADGARNEYMTLIGGGESDEIVHHVAYLGGNSVVVGGLTNSVDFPVTPGAYDTVYGHDGQPSDKSAPGTTTNDAFLARVTLEEQPTGDRTPPPAPQLKGPVVGTQMTAHVLSATFDWTDVQDESGIRAYQLQISPNAEFSFTRDNLVKWWEPWTPTSIEVKDFSISQTGDYWWRVRALDGAGNLGPWSSVWTFTVNDPAPPAAPTLASPPNNGRFAPGNIVFDWNPAARAKFYEIQVDTTSNFSNANRIWLRGITATRQTISLTTERRYWWRVRASNDAVSDGPWSTVWNLEIKRGERLAPVPPPDNDPPPSGPPPAPAGTQVAPFTQTELPLTGAQSGTLTVNLNGPAPAGGATVRIESNYPQFVSAPPSVTIPEGQQSANVTVTASNRVQLRQVVISASYGPGQDYGVRVTSYGGIASPDLYGMSVNGTNVSSGTGTQGRTSFAGGRTVQGTVAFAPGWVAPPGGAVVKLGSTNPELAQVPDEVVVPGGQNSADFTVTTAAVSELSYVTILASRSMTHRVELELLPPGALSNLTLNPAAVNGGDPSTGTVTLGSPAPAGGVQVALTSSDTRWATVPASVTVPAGATSATFTVTTFVNNSGEGQHSWITASSGGITRQQLLGVNPPPAPTPNTLWSFTLDPSTVQGGQPSTGRVTLATAAPSGGTRVDISVNSTLASAPPFVTIPAGQTATTFTITTQPHQGLDALVIVGVGTVNSSREATLRITQTTTTPPPPSVSALSLSPATVIGGQSSTGTVTLTSAAPSGGLVVALASSNTSAATVPASVTVAAGSSSATFTVTTLSGSTTRTSTISAAAGGVTRTATLTVNASAPAGDTVAIQRAEFDGGNRRLRVEATSTSSSATLRVYVTSTDTLIGTLSNNGGGRYSADLAWSTNPQSITVRSSLGGSATSAVTVK